MAAKPCNKNEVKDMAYNAGSKARTNNLPNTANPYEDALLKGYWNLGYLKGGYMVQAKVYKSAFE